MRYRPLGQSGMALSSLGLRLGDEHFRRGRAYAQKLILGALENGINTYHFDCSHPDLLTAAHQAFDGVDRHLLFISVNAHSDHSPAPVADYALRPLRERLKGIVRDSGLRYIDLLMFHADGFDKVEEPSQVFLDSLKEAGLVRHTGASANTDRIRAVVDHGGFDVLKTVFDIDTNWDKRHLLDHAIGQNIDIIGHDYFPAAYQKAAAIVPKAARRGLFGVRASDPLAGSGTYAFLHQTPGWSAEALCLGYTLSQTTLSSVLISPDTPEHLQELAEVTERFLPPSVPAQIEMARFCAQGDKRTQKV